MSAFDRLPPAIKITTPDEARALCQHLASCDLLAFDTETTGLSRQRCYALILSLSDGIGRWAIWPEALPYFQDLLENPRVRLIGHNANFDQWMLLNVGIDLNRRCPRNYARVIDTMVMHALLDDAAPHDLKYLSRYYLGIEMVPFKQVYGVQMRTRSLEQILLDPVNEAVTVNYSALDAFATFKLFKLLQLELERATITESPYANLWEYYVRSELLYTKVLWELEREGIALDRNELLRRAPAIELECMQILNWFCRRERRFDVNLNSGPQMHALFFGKLGHKPITYTEEGAPQLSKAALKTWAKQGCEYSERLLRYRDLSKQLSTYVVGLLDKIFYDGKVHATFVQTGARCMPAGELVLTSRGYLPVERVRAGDLVITHNNRPRRVEWSGENGVQPLTEVVLSNGLVLRTTANHAYRTAPGEWVDAELLQPGVAVQVHSAQEDWRPVAGWADFMVCSWGRVRNMKAQSFLTPWPKGTWGHLKVCLYRDGAQRRGPDRMDFAVHRLVAQAFLPPVAGAPEVRHLDGVAWNNTVANLRWGTSQENKQDAVRHGTMFYPAYVPAPFASATVVSVRTLPAEMTYGLTVEEDHSHVTGGIVTHNTGRLAARDPNLQNQPPHIRSAYIAAPGTFLYARDFAQLEMRILAHVSGDETLIDAINTGKDVHAATAANMFKVPYERIMAAKAKHEAKEEMSDEETRIFKMRAAAKTINFGIMYGMGPSKLARELGVSTDEAKAIIKQYFDACPKIQEYFARVIAGAYRNGYCRTVLGRRRQVTSIWSPFSGERARAERQVKNAPIQGFASEITKLAMLDIHCDEFLAARGVRMLIQVHDEIVFKIPLEEENNQQLFNRIADHMTNAVVRVLGYPLKIVLDTSGAQGHTWLDCK